MIATKTFYVVDRDGPEYQGLSGQWKRDRSRGELAASVAPGDSVRDVLTVAVADDGRVTVRSALDDHRHKVTVGFRVAWGDQYEPGAEHEVTRDFFRRIVTGEDDTDSAGVWLGRHFGWTVEEVSGEDESLWFADRSCVFDSAAVLA